MGQKKGWPSHAQVFPLFLLYFPLYFPNLNVQIVGTLKQGYPLLQYEDAVPARLSLAAWRTAPDPTTWPEKTISSKVSTVGPDPHGKVLDPCIYGPDLRAGSRTSAGTNRTPWTGPGPLCVGSGPLSAGSRDSGTKNTQALIKAKRGSGADTCPDHTEYAPAPRSGEDPMLLHGRLPVT
jgi:hypothetical protein